MTPPPLEPQGFPSSQDGLALSDGVAETGWQPRAGLRQGSARGGRRGLVGGALQRGAGLGSSLRGPVPSGRTTSTSGTLGQELSWPLTQRSKPGSFLLYTEKQQKTWQQPIPHFDRPGQYPSGFPYLLNPTSVPVARVSVREVNKQSMAHPSCSALHPTP